MGRRLVRIRHLGYMAALSLLFFLQPEMAAAKCQLQWLGFLPVEMHGLSPIVSAKINGAARAADIATVKYLDFLDTVWPNAQFVVVNQGVSDNPAGLIDKIC